VDERVRRLFGDGGGEGDGDDEGSANDDPMHNYSKLAKLSDRDHASAASPAAREPRIHDGFGGVATLGHRAGFAFINRTPQEEGEYEDMLLRQRNELAERWRSPTPQPVVDESVEDAGKRKRGWPRWEAMQRAVQGGSTTAGGEAWARHRRALGEMWRRRP
jgi:hypothetical protein